MGGGTCTGIAVPQLNTNVLRHEGHTQALASHFGVANTQFSALRPDTLFERLYTHKDDAALVQLATSTYAHFRRTGGPYANAQRTFDNNDIPLVFGQNISCGVFDFNPNDP